MGQIEEQYNRPKIKVTTSQPIHTGSEKATAEGSHCHEATLAMDETTNADGITKARVTAIIAASWITILTYFGHRPLIAALNSPTFPPIEFQLQAPMPMPQFLPYVR